MDIQRDESLKAEASILHMRRKGFTPHGREFLSAELASLIGIEQQVLRLFVSALES